VPRYGRASHAGAERSPDDSSQAEVPIEARSFSLLSARARRRQLRYADTARFANIAAAGHRLYVQHADDCEYRRPDIDDNAIVAPLKCHRDRITLPMLGLLPG